MVEQQNAFHSKSNTTTVSSKYITLSYVMDYFCGVGLINQQYDINEPRRLINSCLVIRLINQRRINTR